MRKPNRNPFRDDGDPKPPTPQEIERDKAHDRTAKEAFHKDQRSLERIRSMEGRPRASKSNEPASGQLDLAKNDPLAEAAKREGETRRPPYGGLPLVEGRNLEKRCSRTPPPPPAGGSSPGGGKKPGPPGR